MKESFHVIDVTNVDALDIRVWIVEMKLHARVAVTTTQRNSAQKMLI